MHTSTFNRLLHAHAQTLSIGQCHALRLTRVRLDYKHTDTSNVLCLCSIVNHLHVKRAMHSCLHVDFECLYVRARMGLIVHVCDTDTAVVSRLKVAMVAIANVCRPTIGLYVYVHSDVYISTIDEYAIHTLD